MATIDGLTARELVRSGSCIGCASVRPVGGNLWCRGCIDEMETTGLIPDLLRGGEAMRRPDEPLAGL